MNGQPYIAFRVVNASHAVAYIGLADAGHVRCLGVLPDAAAQSYGYYALTATTELRAFTGTGCTGGFRAWVNTTLSTYRPNTGYLALSLPP